MRKLTTEMKKALTLNEALILRDILVAHMEEFEKSDLAREDETKEEIKERKQTHSEYTTFLEGILAKLNDGGAIDRYREKILRKYLKI